MSKYKQEGKGGILKYISKKAVRPLGYKRIRTSTGAYKLYSKRQRGKRIIRGMFFIPKTRSSNNLKKKLTYMNERIAGKTQKIEEYAVKLKEAQILSKDKINSLKKQLESTTNPNIAIKLNFKISKIEKELTQKMDKISKKVTKAQKSLTEKVNKYKPKQEKYSHLIEKKIYKSQKRLNKGFTKTCRNLKTTGKSSIGCLEAFEICRKKHANLDIKGLTGCVNTESAAMGLPSDIQETQVTDMMTKLANKHFIRRFKRRRHLREINRITTHGSELEQIRDKSKGTIIYGEKLQSHQMKNGQKSFNQLGQFSKERTMYKQLQNSSPNMPLSKLEKRSYEQFDKSEIAQKLRKEHPSITPDQLKVRTNEIYEIQKDETRQIISSLKNPKDAEKSIEIAKIRDLSKSQAAQNIEDAIKTPLLMKTTSRTVPSSAPVKTLSATNA